MKRPSHTLIELLRNLFYLAKTKICLHENYLGIPGGKPVKIIKRNHI